MENSLTCFMLLTWSPPTNIAAFWETVLFLFYETYFFSISTVYRPLRLLKFANVIFGVGAFENTSLKFRLRTPSSGYLWFALHDLTYFNDVRWYPYYLDCQESVSAAVGRCSTPRLLTSFLGYSSFTIGSIPFFLIK